MAESSEFAALIVDGGTAKLRGYGGYTISIGNIRNTTRDRCGDDQDKVKEFLAHYPSLTGWMSPPGQRQPIEWRDYGPARSALNLAWPYPSPTSPEADRTARQVRSILYRGGEDWWVFPVVGSMTEALHPLLAWWSVLFALSMMARYEPANWASMIRIDSGVDANGTEHILDQALDVVPSLVLEAIRAICT
jgi:hypothetical protein